jgi:Fic family protein
MITPPVFSLTPGIRDLVKKLDERSEDLAAKARAGPEDQTRLRGFRIEAIWASCAIEANPLSLDQVTDVLEGRPPRGESDDRSIREVQNASEAYDLIGEVDPYATDGLLKAHGAMTRGLIDESGSFRTVGVGVFAGGAPIYIAPRSSEVPALVENLLAWGRTAETRPLIKSGVIHYELERIHPFRDGNGRAGRPWRTLVLSGWRRLWAWVPAEAEILRRDRNTTTPWGAPEERGIAPNWWSSAFGLLTRP